MYWNILVWMRIAGRHVILNPKRWSWKFDYPVTGGTKELQTTLRLELMVPVSVTTQICILIASCVLQPSCPVHLPHSSLLRVAGRGRTRHVQDPHGPGENIWGFDVKIFAYLRTSSWGSRAACRAARTRWPPTTPGTAAWACWCRMRATDTDPSWSSW